MQKRLSCLTIKKDYIDLRQYYPNVLPPLEPCKTEELFAYILLAEPIIRSKSEYNVGRSINRLFVELLRGQESVYGLGVCTRSISDSVTLEKFFKTTGIGD